jgi:hypothetical protein
MIGTLNLLSIIGLHPVAGTIENVADDADLEGVYETERHLLCVACTRACDSRR